MLKVEGKLAGADGRDEILQEGAKKGEGDTINSDGDETDDDEAAASQQQQQQQQQQLSK